MSRRTAGRLQAVRKAWENEKNLVLEGKCTRDWTPEQQEQIAEKGKAYDDQGRAFEGQHMKSVSAYPEYLDDPRNIQFLTREEHLAVHGGSWMNQTKGYYDPVSKTMSDFGDGPPHPCAEVPLTTPLYAKHLIAASPRTPSAESTTGTAPANPAPTPKGTWRQVAQSMWRSVKQASKDPRVQATAASVFVGAAKMYLESSNQDRSSRGDRTAARSTQPFTRMAASFGTDSLEAPLESPSSRESRQSPDEHGVSGYTRKNGSNVGPYRRGGKKD